MSRVAALLNDLEDIELEIETLREHRASQAHAWELGVTMPGYHSERDYLAAEYTRLLAERQQTQLKLDALVDTGFTPPPRENPVDDDFDEDDYGPPAKTAWQEGFDAAQYGRHRLGYSRAKMREVVESVRESWPAEYADGFEAGAGAPPARENPAECEVAGPVLDLYETFHGTEPRSVTAQRVWVPGDLALLGPCLDVGYGIVDRSSNKSGRYVHDHKNAVKVYRRAKAGERVAKSYAPGRFPTDLVVLGQGIGFTYQGASGDRVEVPGTTGKRLCTNSKGNMLVCVDKGGVKYVIRGGKMRVSDWIYD